jgi:hypothetical protein
VRCPLSFHPSNLLCVDQVVLSVRSDEMDVNDPIGAVNPHHNPILVAGKIEHYAAVFETLALRMSRLT